MPDIELQRLRKLRAKAEDLLNTLISDLEPFQARDRRCGFRRTPEAKVTPRGDVNVTTTCSCLMGLAHAGKIGQFYGTEAEQIVQDIVANVMTASWQSSGLKPNNAFTTALVIRLCGSLVKSKYLTTSKLRKLTKSWTLDSDPKIARTRTLEGIARYLSKDEDRFRINNYPPAAAVVYWFVDGVDHSRFDLGDEWSVLCKYATEEFRRQRSLVVAKHTAMMDPVAMAMAACLCARLRSVSKRRASSETGQLSDDLPSMIELERAVVDLFAEQTPTGLWSKYFPIFHYNEAGSNYCYTFELLEAVILEFGENDNHILLEETVIAGLEKAVASCEANRLECSGPKDGITSNPQVRFNGWNSGGNFKTLRRGEPESWATAVVHMFLRALIDVLSRHIQQRLLKQYDARTHHHKSKGLSGLLDISVRMSTKETSLRGVLQSRFVDTFSAFSGEKAEALLNNPMKKKPLSALLFGPPGTSKTEVAKALAANLQWPLVEIDPSRFLQNSFQNIYVQAETIFKDVMDLYGAVVLFDELDALVQSRDGIATPDIESTFLTTYMLPKLAKLHDQGRLIFLMATNFQEKFDDAIKRAGRFDVLLCMGPPTLKEKCSSLQVFLGNGKQIKTGGALLLKYAQSDTRVADQLSLYTYGEFLSFISRLGNANNIRARVKAKAPEGIRRLVQKDSQSVGLRLEDLDVLNTREYEGTWTPGKWSTLSDLYAAKFYERKIAKVMGQLTPAVKYVIERKKSKYQI